MRSPTVSEPGVGNAWLNDAVICLESVSVRYMVPHERIASFKEYAIRALQRRVHHEVFWALRDVSLTVERGETFGIIGRNGAGKSTLLKVIARVLRPASGRVIVRGRVAPLLELGAGFHSELTGRENVYLNGALLGLSKATIQALIDEIIDFAEIWEFIDAPLRTYSTGMVARLGFAVATAVRPEILIVDEVLSVGDQPFQEKCTERMTAFRQQGTTILIVSHSAALVGSLCQRAAWFDRGSLKIVGDSATVLEEYHQAMTHS